jgi:predicted nucleic-acid-binding protein
MIALDTNVLVRLLVRDDARQSRRARQLVDRELRSGEPVFVPDVALVETVWVLGRSYHFERGEIGSAVSKLLASRDVVVEDRDRLMRALRAFELGRGGFADYLIHEQALKAGCDAVHTFDRRLIREPGFDKV